MPDSSQDTNLIEKFGTQIKIESTGNIWGLAPTQAPEAIKYTYGATGWAALSGTEFFLTFPRAETLPAGVYTLREDCNFGIVFSQRVINSDAYLEFSEGPLTSILEDIDFFWTRADAYAFFGFTFKRGILLFGKAGAGKSILVYQSIARFVKKHNGIVVLATGHPAMLDAALTALRKPEPDRRIMVVIEDIDAYIQECGEERLLSFLDGEMSLQNCLVIATTNYPERLDKRIVSRPRRFDRLIEIKAPTLQMRREYLVNKLKLTNGEVEKFARATEEFTFAALAELVISVKCLDKDFDISCNEIKELLVKKRSSSTFDSSSVGFGKE